MLIAITIENFKGIRAPVTIPIRPLTVMFGKNSAGKSTIVQALHYAREVLLENNPNADRTKLGGASVDLGGFRNLVHKRRTDLPIVIRFDLDVSQSEFPEYGDRNAEEVFVNEWIPLLAGREQVHVSPTTSPRDLNLYTDYIVPLQEHGKEILTSVEFTVRWSEARQDAVLTEFKTCIDGEEVGRVTNPVDSDGLTAEINLNHHFFRAEDSESKDPIWARLGMLVAGSIGIFKPNWNMPILESEIPEDVREAGLGPQAVSQMMFGPVALLTGYISAPGLKDMRYLGPLRETAPRVFRRYLGLGSRSWSEGLGAWDRLYDNENDLVDAVGVWLGEGMLGTGYSLGIERYRELPLHSPLMIALANNSIFDDIEDLSAEVSKYPIRERISIIEEKTGLWHAPADVGMGISQVIPVVAAAIDSYFRIVAIEQPELHLHPAVQAELGDLFIRSALENTNIFFLETHSEHLILRILRRIRETSDGDDLGNASRIDKDDVSLVYIEPDVDGTKVLSLPVTSEGDFVVNVPGGFFAERAKELF